MGKVVQTACGVITHAVLLALLTNVQLAIAYEGDYIWEERFKASLVSAQSGQAKAQYAVADMYLRGRGTSQDSNKALHWFLRAAKQGHKKAAYKVGHLYLHVSGISPTVPGKQAFQWIQKSARAGYAPAQYELAQQLFEGNIVKRNTAQALKWMGRAKMADYAPAHTGFDQMVKRLVKETSALPR